MPLMPRHVAAFAAIDADDYFAMPLLAIMPLADEFCLRHLFLLPISLLSFAAARHHHACHRRCSILLLIAASRYAAAAAMRLLR